MKLQKMLVILYRKAKHYKFPNFCDIDFCTTLLLITDLVDIFLELTYNIGNYNKSQVFSKHKK